MELTKIEKRILEGKNQKWDKIILWIGVIFLIFSIATIFWTHHIVKKVYRPFHDTYLLIQEDISPKTELEIKLKGSLLTATNGAKEGWTKYAETKGLVLFQSFLFMGIFLTTTYFTKKVYIKLIKKLKR